MTSSNITKSQFPKTIKKAAFKLTSKQFQSTSGLSHLCSDFCVIHLSSVYPCDPVHQRRQLGAAVGQRRVPVVERAAEPGSGHRPRAAVPAQQGHLPQGPHLQGDDTRKHTRISALVQNMHITEHQRRLILQRLM